MFQAVQSRANFQDRKFSETPFHNKFYVHDENELDLQIYCHKR
jgi:hypothetical protein